MNDILERLKASSKINGAYPKDIEDAIKEILFLREFKNDILFHLNFYDDEDDGAFLTEESLEELKHKYHF